MRKFPALLALMLLSDFAGARSSERSQHIRDFRYTSCGSKSCVQIVSAGAFVSLFGGAFSTEGSAELKLTDRSGKLLVSHSGSEARFNPALQLITLSKGDEGFYLYSLKDEKFTAYLNPRVAK